MILIILSFISLGCLILYAVSNKQVKRTQQSKYAVLAIHIPYTKLIALILFTLAFVLLSFKFGWSVGFVSFWILLSPILFILILKNKSV